MKVRYIRWLFTAILAYFVATNNTAARITLAVAVIILEIMTSLGEWKS